MHVPDPGGPGGGGEGRGEDGGRRSIGYGGTVGGRGGVAPLAQLPPTRGPQSAQSWHGVHVENSEPSPPSSQSPSRLKMHVFSHTPAPGGPGGGACGWGASGRATSKVQYARGPQS